MKRLVEFVNSTFYNNEEAINLLQKIVIFLTMVSVLLLSIIFIML